MNHVRIGIGESERRRLAKLYPESFPNQSPQPGLGDYTEQLLSTIGVTKDRYRAAKEAFGLAPTCDCEQRQEWLNKVGKWIGL